ncbi:MAG: hypothetical protein IPI67_39785 [Myxococcales bacterium]|nr:hypothetical protein [Myxococcales bacterium]
MRCARFTWFSAAVVAVGMSAAACGSDSSGGGGGTGGATGGAGGAGGGTGGTTGGAAGAGGAGGSTGGAAGASGGAAGAPALAFLPADRVPPAGTWESAGVEGGIPNRTTNCADVTKAPYNADPTGAADAAPAIQKAIDACPDGQVVFVPAGKYKIGSLIKLPSAITLRGAGSATVFDVVTSTAVRIGGLGPWPPPKVNDSYRTPITSGATRASKTVDIADTSGVEVGKMVMIDEEDDPTLVWTKNGSSGRYRASMHRVEAKTATSVTFRPPLPIDFVKSPQLSWFPDLTELAGVEKIKFVGNGSNPGQFIQIESSWNCWVFDCEFTAMPSKTVVVDWSAHIELRRIYMHDQANGGSNSEGLDFLTDVSFSLIIDNICVAAGFPQINIGDGGANPNYSGGFGNVIAYNYAVDAYYTDPPTSTNAGKMPHDISTNHSPHSQYNLVEGNFIGKFGADGYHGSGSHTLLYRNRITGAASWPHVTNLTAIQIDRRNLNYSIIGNVLGRPGKPPSFEYATTNNWTGSTIYRLGYPDIGNDGFNGTFPPTALASSDGGPRDLYCERTTAPNGTTLIEGNWTSAAGKVDWSVPSEALPPSFFLAQKPSWFGSLAWPPVDASGTPADDPSIIPAGYRYVNGSDPP